MTQFGRLESPRTWITGTDDNQVDILLDWFIPQLLEKSDKSVIVADMGLKNPENIKRIQELAAVNRRIYFARLDPQDSRVAGWFRKPYAISHAVELFDEVIWIDCDIQILESIDGLFDLLEQGKLLIADDWYRQFAGVARMKNTGIVGAKGSPSILKRWKDTCVSSGKRGDQEALYALLEAKGGWDQIVDMPIEYHGQRLMKGSVDLGPMKAIHWTGPVGKAYIRESLMHG